MDLFGYDPELNILPCDGEVFYFGQIVDSDLSKKLHPKIATKYYLEK